ncbi:MAG: DUF374 domain-containing protein [Planctomycetota bacterium]|jgi:hypothetical protein|nr:DUF374 domain-containing protein [Planctomycetota bacterium]
MRRILLSFKKGFLFRLLLSTAPVFFRAYMGFVHLTSRKTYIGMEESLWKPLRRGENLFAAIAHQDALIAAYEYRGSGFLILISQSRDGDLIAEISHRLGYGTVRGSSSRGGRAAVRELQEHYEAHRESGRGLLTAITVDGPRGPAFQIKPGVVHLARKTGSGIVIQRGWAKHKILLKSWDRTVIPLPFNHFVFHFEGPFQVPPLEGGEDFDQFRLNIEGHLRRLALRSVEVFPGFGLMTSSRRRQMGSRIDPAAFFGKSWFSPPVSKGK